MNDSLTIMDRSLTGNSTEYGAIIIVAGISAVFMLYRLVNWA
jgi:hypothetical protein